MASIFFTEKQYLRKTPQMFMVIFFTIFVFSVFILQLLQLLSVVDSFLSPKQEIIIFRIFEILLIFLLFILVPGYFMKMEIIISDQDVKFRMSPFMKRFRIIGKENIKKFEVVKSNKISGYNGWSIRRAFGRRKGIFTIRGNYGLRIVLTNGEKVILGTQKKQAAISAMKKLMKKANNK